MAGCISAIFQGGTVYRIQLRVDGGGHVGGIWVTKRKWLSVELGFIWFESGSRDTLISSIIDVDASVESQHQVHRIYASRTEPD